MNATFQQPLVAAKRRRQVCLPRFLRSDKRNDAYREDARRTLEACLEIFGCVFTEQIGSPVPAAPALIAAGALAACGQLARTCEWRSCGPGMARLAAVARGEAGQLCRTDRHRRCPRGVATGRKRRPGWSSRLSASSSPIPNISCSDM